MMASRFEGKNIRIMFCFMFLSSSLIFAGDWPQWKGPNRDSICTETGLLQEWPEEGPKLLWKCTGLGGGYSTIAIAKDKFFTTGDHRLTKESER